MLDKSVIDSISGIISDLKIPDEIVQVLFQEILRAYDFGVIDIEKVINQNIIDVNDTTINFLQKYTFDLIKDMNIEMAGKLKTVLERNILEEKSYLNVVSDIKDIFETTVNRAKMIARTESARAFAMGQLESARISPVKLKKYVLTVHDKRTSPLCRRLSTKYDINHPIPINQKFKDNKTGESWIMNPFHPNCRSKAVFIPVKK